MGKISDFVYPELQTTQKLSFSGDNFLIWKLKLSFVLADHQLCHLIKPSSANPTTTRNEENVHAVKWLIIRTLDENLARGFYRDSSTPESILETLFNRFDSLLKMSADIKLRKYKNYRMASDAHVSQHIFRMRAMAKELEHGSGVKIPDEVQSMFLLNSLPDDWEADVEGLLRGLDGREEDLGFINFSRRLRVLQHVRKLKKFSNGKKRAIGPCYTYGRKGHHYKSDCPDRGSLKQESSSNYVEFPMFTDDATLSEILYLSLKSRLRIDHKGSNFPFWKRDIFEVLEDSKVDYVIKEPEPHPADSASEEDAHLSMKWHADDFTCRHLILGTMEDDVFLSFHDYPTAKALMEALEAFFNSSSTAQKLVKLKKYMSHRMEEDTLIMSHICKMEYKAMRMGNIGMDIPSEMQSVFLLDSLPESWSGIRRSLEMNLDFDEGDDAWSFDNVRKRVKDAGQLKEVMDKIHEVKFQENANGSMKNKRVQRGKCYSCGKSGHYQSNCPDQR